MSLLERAAGIRRHLRVAATVAVAATATVPATVPATVTQPTAAAATTTVDDEDWLGVVNAYRSLSGLQPVTEEPSWSTGAYEHSCYMVQNNEITHYQDPSKPGATPDGANAGLKGNVAVSSNAATTARRHVELWMTGPFHAIGILRPELERVGFGKCANADGRHWRSGATLNILDGLGTPIPQTAPIVFPGDGARTSLYRFIAETPNPVTMCGWDGPAGLPLIAMMPNEVTKATATLHGPDGEEHVCVLDPSNAIVDGRNLLAHDNAVVVVPRNHLGDGDWTATVNSDGGNANWSFTVDRDTPLVGNDPPVTVPPVDDVTLGTRNGGFEPVIPTRVLDTRHRAGGDRLRAGDVTTIRFPDAPSDAVAVAVNATAVDGNGAGYVTLYDCGANIPTVSTLNYNDQWPVPNGALIPLSVDTTICAYAHTDVDLLIDVTGWVTEQSEAGFVPLTPQRVHDSRTTTSPLTPNTVARVNVAGRNGVDSSATAVAVNVTVVDADRAGYVTVWPCGTTRPEASNLNVRAGETRANNVTVGVDNNGDLCVSGTVGGHLLVDVNGYHGTNGARFTAATPTRLVDTRDPHPALQAGQHGQRATAHTVVRFGVAGHRGIPTDVAAVAVNVTAVDTVGDGYVTVWPCNGPAPNVSTLNYRGGGPAVPNGAVARLAADGTLCAITSADAHLIVDVNAVVR